MGVLSKLVVSTTGDLGPGKNNNQLQKWVEANGGRWSPKVTNDVTHLVCSKEAYRKGVDAVTKARNLGVQIVSYDWLEDSLQKKRKLAEKKYSWVVLAKEKRKRKEHVRVGKDYDTMKFEKGNREACVDLGTGTSNSPSPSSSARKSSAKPKEGFFSQSLAAMREERLAKQQAAAEGSTMETEKLQAAKEGDAATPASFQGTSGSRSRSPQRTVIVSSASSPPTPSPKACVRSKVKPTQKSVSCQVSVQSPASISTTAPAGPRAEKLTDNYHTYVDNTGFDYNITFIRSNLCLNIHARYNLRIYESNTKPSMYCTFIRYCPPRGTAWPNSSNISSLEVQPGNGSAAPVKSETDEGKDNKPATDNQKPNAARPFRTLLTPLNSEYNAAFASFRTAFHDLTFLTWEERILPFAKALQKSRAKQFNLEPFVYIPPAQGMPTGMQPSFPGTLTTPTPFSAIGNLDLPAMDLPLSKEHSIGGAIFREAQEERRRKEEDEEQAVLQAAQKDNMKLGAQKPRVESRKPLFNTSVGGPEPEDDVHLTAGIKWQRGFEDGMQMQIRGSRGGRHFFDY